MASGKQRKGRETPERKLADAQAKLHSAQEKRKRIMAEAELTVERARKRAAKQVETITRQVERRAGKVARAQAQLATAGAGDRSRRKSTNGPAKKASPATPVGVAELLADVQEQTLTAQEQTAVVTSDGLSAQSAAGAANQELTRYQLQALASLHENFSVNGATFTEWLAASRMSKRPFLSARRSLVDGGLVARTGDGQGARYVVTEAGALSLA